MTELPATFSTARNFVPFVLTPSVPLRHVLEDGMNRILISTLGHGLLGLSVLGMAALGFLWYSPTGATPPGKQEGEWRLLGPGSYENLTGFPVGSSSGDDTSAFLTLEDGLSNGEVTVRGPGAAATYLNPAASHPGAQNYA